jgi:predicted lipoprotein with Yx(FWY)xxD motif
MDTDRASRLGTPAAGSGSPDRQPGPRGRAGWAGRAVAAGLRIAGAGLLIAMAAIHLDLYVTGYQSIPTIGGLFLFQVIVAFILGAVVLITGSRLAAAAGALFALATLGGYLLSIWVGLFGFTEVRTTAGIAAGVVEVTAFAVLGVLAICPRPARRPPRPGTFGGQLAAWVDAGAPGAVPAIGLVTVVAAVLLGVAVAGADGPPSSQPPGSAAGSALLKTTTISGATVLTNSKGFTLYWFAPDTPTKSVCNGACAAYWPPVAGQPAAGPGVSGRLSMITRSDGSVQASYDGHPLYTYVGDTAPGQAKGNNLNLNGGVWHEVPVSG